MTIVRDCTRVLLTTLFGAGAVHAQVVECSPEQRLALAVSQHEAGEHRKTPLRAVTYPAGTKRSAWTFPLTLRVSAAGVVECYEQSTTAGHEDIEKGLDAPRRAVIDDLTAWRYAPFIRDGKALPVVVHETLREERLPSRRRSPPDVAADRVRIALERMQCNGSCPAYFVELHGDGRAVYDGRAHVVVLGRHEYRVDPAQVARLVERARSANLWSMDPGYRAKISDNPTATVWITLGKEVREIEDYAGERVGMPVAITEFQELVDEVARTREWVGLSLETVDVLKAEGFDFSSREAAELLARAVRGDTLGDDAALARLVELGTPFQGSEERPIIDSALIAVRPRLVEALIERGALATAGRTDQAKIDAAFRAAIRGGDAALIERMWNAAGDTPHPAMTFEDVAGDRFDESKPTVRKVSDVILLLDGAYSSPPKRLSPAMKFLVSKGSDVRATRANGSTLLHIAAHANDADFVRYLLAQRLDPNAVDLDGILPVGTTYDEEVTMLLLEAGTDLSRISTEGYSYRRFVESQNWHRVLAWMSAHGH